jgi:hypothetical protein
MSLSLGSALFAFALSIICSMVVAKRSSNRRIRLLALTVGLLPLCEAVVLLGRHHVWLGTEVAEVAEVFIRGLSVATFGPTDYSRFCDACAQAEIEIEKPAGDIPSIPPPASFYFRQHDDASHMMRLGANAAGNTAAVAKQAGQAGIEQGFRAGRRF